MNNNFEIKSLEKVKTILETKKGTWVSANSIQQEVENSLSHTSIKNILNYLCDQENTEKMTTSAGTFYKLKGSGLRE